MLQVVFWSVLFAIALTRVQGRPKEAILAFAEGVAEVMFKFVAIIMRFAPIGIGAAMAVTVAHSGIDVVVNLGKLVLTLYGALVANLICLPIADKLHGKLIDEETNRTLIIDGILMIRDSKSPALVREMLLAYLPEKHRDEEGELAPA